MTLTIDKGAIFSEDRVYRYVLWRTWDITSPSIAFIGLNPSTADELVDDPTIRRCVGFAKAWGYGRLVMLNLFAFRSTDPKQLRFTKDPVGPLNDHYLDQYCREVEKIIAAWGSNGGLYFRGRHLWEKYPQMLVLGWTTGHHPKHPLYIPMDTQPQSREV